MPAGKRRNPWQVSDPLGKAYAANQHTQIAGTDKRWLASARYPTLPRYARFLSFDYLPWQCSSLSLPQTCVTEPIRTGLQSTPSSNHGRLLTGRALYTRHRDTGRAVSPQGLSVPASTLTWSSHEFGGDLLSFAETYILGNLGVADV